MTDFHFLRPLMLLWMVPFIVLVLLHMFKNRRATIWQKVCSTDLLPYVVAADAKRNWLPYTLLITIGILLISALAGPSWQKTMLPLTKSQSALVIALDLSASMDSTDSKPSRLQRAIYKIDDLLLSRKEGQTALVVFSEDPYIVTPLTDDVETIKTMLPVLQTNLMPAPGQKPAKAIVQACELLNRSGVSHGSILLITSQMSPQELEKSIQIAKEKAVAVSILGVGTEDGAPIPNAKGGFVKDKNGEPVIAKLAKDQLQQLSAATGGSYATLSFDDSDLQLLAKGFTATDERNDSDQNHEKWNDGGYLLVLAALPLISLFFQRGMLFLLLFFMPCSLQAFSWNDLWKSRDQQAEERFYEQQYKEAQELFENPDWLGAASYKLGDYNAAVEFFGQNQSADGYYNLGNAQAKKGDFEASLGAYNKALEIDPDHEDALYNKKLIEEQMQKNQQEQDKQDQNKQEQDKQEQDKDQDQDKDRDKQDAEGSDKPSQDEHKEEEAEADPPENDAQQQGDEKWLQKVKDDPGGLLRRKFMYQYQQKQNTQRTGQRQ